MVYVFGFVTLYLIMGILSKVYKIDKQNTIIIELLKDRK